MPKLTIYPYIVSLERTEKILEQMKKCICKIIVNGCQATGFFCKIPFPNINNMLHVLITCNHVIGEQLLNQEEARILLDIKEEDQPRELCLYHRLYYTNKEFDITIIEIKSEDKIFNFLELDDIIINDILNNINKTIIFQDETICVLQYPEGKLSVSYGIFDRIFEDKKYPFVHKCATEEGSGGSPILNINNNKLIGLHIGSYRWKYNLGLLLNYPIKDFIMQNFNIDNNNNNINNTNQIMTDLNEIKLKEFNNKYSLNIKNLKIDKINFSRKNFYQISNQLFDDLSLLEFKELKGLYFYQDKLSDISGFQKFKFQKLEILDLSNNNIEDIKVFKKVNFSELKTLRLVRNKISDIGVLANVKFEKLEKLNLSENKISDINTLAKSNFKELKELNLSDNNISDIQILGKVVFNKLEILNLSKNHISDINILKKVDFKILKELYLNNNNITDIKVFEKEKLYKLEILSLGNNEIDKLKNAVIISNLSSKIKEFDI